MQFEGDPVPPSGLLHLGVRRVYVTQVGQVALIASRVRECQAASSWMVKRNGAPAAATSRSGVALLES